MSASSKPLSKVLRLVAIVDDKVSEDLHQSAPQGISIGTRYGADVMVFGKKAPVHHQLFDYRQGTYVLDLPAHARGKIRMGSKAVSVERLRKRYAKGGACRIRLDARAKGKLRIGNSTVLFQFGPPKPRVPKLPFPAAFKASVVGMVGAMAVYSQLASASILGPVFAWANFSEVPVGDEMDIDQRFLVAVGRIQPSEPSEPEPEEEELEDERAEESTEVVRAKPKPAPVAKVLKQKPAKFSEAAVKQARNVGVARVLGTYGGEGPGSVFDVIQSTQNRLGELADAGMTTTVQPDGPLGDLAPIGADGIGEHGQLTQTKGFETGTGPEVAAARTKKRERKVRGRAKASGTQADGGGDKKAIKATIKYRTNALQHCYNKALRTQPDLSGKMTFTIMVNVMGSVTKVMIEGDTLGSAAVAACTKAKIKGWRFPMDGADEGAEVTFSVVFSGS